MPILKQENLKILNSFNKLKTCILHFNYIILDSCVKIMILRVFFSKIAY